MVKGKAFEKRAMQVIYGKLQTLFCIFLRMSPLMKLLHVWLCKKNGLMQLKLPYAIPWSLFQKLLLSYVNSR